MRIPNECESKTNSCEISCEENDSEIKFTNTDEEGVRVFEVDECAITGDVDKCDWLVIDDSGKEHFIELKSKTKVSHGIDQLGNTIRLMCSDKRNPDRLSFLVHKRSPQYRGKIQIRVADFEEEFNSPLYVRKSPHTHAL